MQKCNFEAILEKVGVTEFHWFRTNDEVPLFKYLRNRQYWPVPVAERSNTRVYGRSRAEIAGSNPAGGMDGFRCVLSGRGVCDGLVTHPEESYRLWCVLVCDLGTSRMRGLKLVTVVNAG